MPIIDTELFFKEYEFNSRTFEKKNYVIISLFK